MFQTGTATDYKDLLTKLVQVATSNSCSAAVVNAGGTGYTVGDILTASGGTSSFPATFEVTSVSTGAVTGVRIRNGGAYTVSPSNPVSVTGGTGSGCTLNLTITATGWTAVRDTTPGGEKEVILQGVGGGSDTVFVGFKTYQVLSQNGIDTAYNWTVVGMTGFNTGLAFDAQPGVSPGGTPTSSGGSYVALKTSDAFAIDFWFNITGRRIFGVARTRNATVDSYQSWYAGWMNPGGTSTEYPYPIVVHGSSARHDAIWTTTSPSLTGLAESMGISGKTGPCFYLRPDGAWQEVKNSIAVDTGSPTRSVSQAYTTYPSGQPALGSLSVEDVIVADGGFTFDDLIPPTGVPGTETLRLQDTPNTGPDLRRIIPVTLVAASTPNFAILGELDQVYWVSAVGGMSSQDTVTIGGNLYRVFQSGNRALVFSFMAIREY